MTDDRDRPHESAGERRWPTTDAAQLAALTVQVGNVATELTRVAGRVERLAEKVDRLDSKLDRFDGVLGVLRFLGIGGVAVATFALLKAFGVHI